MDLAFLPWRLGVRHFERIHVMNAARSWALMGASLIAIAACSHNDAAGVGSDESAASQTYCPDGTYDEATKRCYVMPLTVLDLAPNVPYSVVMTGDFGGNVYYSYSRNGVQCPFGGTLDSNGCQIATDPFLSAAIAYKVDTAPETAGIFYETTTGSCEHGAAPGDPHGARCYVHLFAHGSAANSLVPSIPYRVALDANPPALAYDNLGACTFGGRPTDAGCLVVDLTDAISKGVIAKQNSVRTPRKYHVDSSPGGGLHGIYFDASDFRNVDPAPVSCGFLGAAVCPGNTCRAMPDGPLVPSNGVCVKCGHLNEPLCSGAQACIQPRTMASAAVGKCVSCGRKGEAVCDAGEPCDAGLERDDGGACNAPWGRIGQRCGSHGQCRAGNVGCYGGVCELACGHLGEGCCGNGIRCQRPNLDCHGDALNGEACKPCGGVNQACCNNTCPNGLYCVVPMGGDSYCSKSNSGGPSGPAVPQTFASCGDACPDGFHISERTSLPVCTNAGMGAVVCIEDIGDKFDLCSLTCPAGYHEDVTQESCTPTCDVNRCAQSNTRPPGTRVNATRCVRGAP